MRKEKLQIIFLIGIVIAGLSYAYVTFMLQPQLNVLQNKQKEATLRRGEYERLLSYSVNPQNLDKEIQIQKNELAVISKTLPIALDKPLLTYNIYTAIKRNNLVAESVVFNKPENKGSYQVIGISFSVLGSTGDIMAIIKELQNSADALVLRSVTFIAQEQATKAELKLQAFALLGKKDSTYKPPFMNVPLGIDSIPRLFSTK